MNSANDVITLEDVDDEIAGRFRMLRFSAPIERKFDADGAPARCRQMIRQNYIGLIVYHAFLYGDHRSIPDAFTTDLIIHFAVITPLVLLTNLVIARRPPVWLRESLQALAMVILAATIVVTVSSSQSPPRDILLFTIILVILFTTFMQRIRFWYALAACLAMQALYSIGLAGLVPFSMDRTIMSTCVFVGTLTFVGYYNLEHEQRMGYLLRLRDHLRNHDLELISLKDALTGVGNRRALDAALTCRVKDSVADAAVSTAILLLDIDHFKAFNDVNGHQEGDVCLRRVAQLVDGAAHDEGQDVYRFGGEEFLVLLKDTTIEAALVVAERIRSAVALAALPRNGSDKGSGPAHVVTISVGAAAGHLDGETTPAALIAAADAALYAAKHNGRNRVWSALHCGPSGMSVTALNSQPRAA